MKYEAMPRPKAKAKEPSLDTSCDVHRLQRVDATYAELIDQPKALVRTLQATTPKLKEIAKALEKRTLDTVMLLGCGDSWFVGNSVIYAIEALTGFRCLSVEAYEFERYYHQGIDERTLVIGQSASGTTETVLRGLSYAQEHKAVCIGMGNTEHSTILSAYDFGIHVPVTRKGWPTQASTSAIGALIALFCHLSLAKGLQPALAQQLLDELELIPRQMEEAIAFNEEPVKKFCESRVHQTYFQASGAGPAFAVAQIAAAKIKELCPAHASAYPLEEFHHYRSLKSDDTLLLIAPQGRSKARELDTALVGAYDEGVIVTIANIVSDQLKAVTDLFCFVPHVSEYLAPLVYCIPVHLFAYYIAIAKKERCVGYPTAKG
ncbi:MAG: SIS domain-containing protein [Spirochaetia bacterium]|nr:SIS domain-containing protein [Spirochaetia bacterium]